MMLKRLTHIMFSLVLLFALASCGEKERTDEEKRDYALERIHAISNESQFVLNSFDMSVLCHRKTTRWFFFSREVLLKVYGHARVGFHPNQIKPSSLRIDSDGFVHLEIPHCELLNLDVEDRCEKPYDDPSFVLPDFTPQEMDELRREAEEKMRQRVRDNELLAITDDRAIKFFKALLATAGFDPKKCEITFDEKSVVWIR